MSSAGPKNNDGDRAQGEELNLTQIMADLRKGEKTADVLESNLSNLEKKIDDLLASFEESERSKIDNGGKKSPELPKEVADEQTDHATGGKS